MGIRLEGLEGLQAQMDQAIEALEVGVANAQTKVAGDFLAGVMERTPVDRGTVRGSWQASATLPDKRKVRQSKTGAGAFGELGRLRFGIGRTVYLTNFHPAIERIEFGTFDETVILPHQRAAAFAAMREREKRLGATEVARRRTAASGGFAVDSPAGMVRVTEANLASRIPLEIDEIIQTEFGR